MGNMKVTLFNFLVLKSKENELLYDAIVTGEIGQVYTIYTMNYHKEIQSGLVVAEPVDFQKLKEVVKEVSDHENVV